MSENKQTNKQTTQQANKQIVDKRGTSTLIRQLILSECQYIKYSLNNGLLKAGYTFGKC